MPTSVATFKRRRLGVAALLCAGLTLSAVWLGGERKAVSGSSTPAVPRISRLAAPRSDADFHIRQLVPPAGAAATLPGSEAVGRADAEFPGVIQNKNLGSTADVELSLYFDDVMGGGPGKVPMFQNVLAWVITVTDAPCPVFQSRGRPRPLTRWRFG